MSEDPADWGGELVALDMVPDHKPDVVHDLSVFPWPFEDDSFDRVEAYELLEHLGQQGDFRAFFRDFQEIWRILRPGGFLAGTTPGRQSPWTWGDPGHTRVISSESMVFLNQAEYTAQVGVTSMSDYRPWFKGDFVPFAGNVSPDGFTFILKAIKPSRLTEGKAARMV
jgi:SAM-dependent methyltransferase